MKKIAANKNYKFASRESGEMWGEFFSDGEPVDLLKEDSPKENKESGSSNVWIVTRQLDFGGGTVQGVFSSEEKAEAAAEKITLYAPGHVDISVYTLDSEGLIH